MNGEVISKTFVIKGEERIERYIHEDVVKRALKISWDDWEGDPSRIIEVIEWRLGL